MLEKEARIFEQNLPELVKTELGKYVLVKDDKIVGAFAAIVDALSYGYEKFKDQPFFIRQVSLVQQPIDFTNHHLFC